MKTHPPIYSHNPHQAEAFPLLVLDVARQVCTPSNEGFRVLHWHEEIQFIFVRQGIIHAHIYDEELDAGAGDCLFINRCVPHKTTEVVDCQYHSYIIPERMLSFFPGSLMEQEEVNALLYHPGFTFFLLRQDNPAHHLPLQKIRQMDDLYFTRKPPRHFHYRLNIALVTFWLEFICVLPSLPPAVEPKDHQRIFAEKYKNAGDCDRHQRWVFLCKFLYSLFSKILWLHAQNIPAKCRAEQRVIYFSLETAVFGMLRNSRNAMTMVTTAAIKSAIGPT